uniref:uncharacterized protein n=1 Tax=Myxine glutinosa TaxID=7769 RepID=UPI00358DDEA2
MEQKKKRTLEIIKSHPEGVLVNSLNSIYGQLHKNGLSVRDSGFTSVQAFLKSLGDDVCLFEKDEQLFVKVKAEDKTRINMAAPAFTTDGGGGTQSPVKAKESKGRDQQAVTVTSAISQVQQLMKKIHSSADGGRKQPVVEVKQKKRHDRKAKTVSAINQGQDDGNNIEILATNLQKLLMQRDPDSVGIPLDKVEGEYMDFFGKPFNNLHITCSTEELVSLMNDHLVLSKSGDCLKVFAKLSMKEKGNVHDHRSCAANFSMSTVKDQIRASIPELKSRIYLILEESEKISMSALARRYSELFGTELQPEQYGFQNLNELLLVVADGCMLQADGSDVILTKRTEPAKPSLKTYVAPGKSACTFEEWPDLGKINLKGSQADAQRLHPHMLIQNLEEQKTGLRPQGGMAPTKFFGQETSRMHKKPLLGKSPFIQNILNQTPQFPLMKAFGQPLPGQTSGQPLLGQTSGQPLPGQTSGRPLPGHTSGRPLPGQTSDRPLPGQTSGQPFPGQTSGQPLPGQTSGQPASIQPLKKMSTLPISNVQTTPTFQQEYFKQLRAVHKTVLSDSEQNENNRHVRVFNKQNLSPEYVDRLAQECIRMLSETEQHITLEKVTRLLCQHLNVNKLQEAGVRDIYKVPALHEFLRVHREIHVFIEAFEKMRSFATLYELEQCLAALKEKQSFKELCLGPLCRHPLVHRVFKVPPTMKDEDIPEITTGNILSCLSAYMKTRRERIDLADFMKHVMEKYGAEDPYSLGVRITSVALGISVVSKVARGEGEAREKAHFLLERELNEEIEKRMLKLKKNCLMTFTTSSSWEDLLRGRYMSSPAAEVVRQVFDNSIDVFGRRTQKPIQAFLNVMNTNEFACKLFQLSICCGSLEAPRDLVAKQDLSPQTKERQQKAPPPSEDALQQKFTEELQRISSSVTLQVLAKIEKRLMEHFKGHDFASLGHGSFIEYLYKHLQLLEDNGFMVTVGAGVSDGHLSRQHVCEFVRQCGVKDATEPSIESALRHHFSVRDSRQLGAGILRNLLKKQQQPSSASHAVVYETALCIRHNRQEFTLEHASFGLLGDQPEQAAYRCLLTAPLLEDLEKWSQWELVFQPQHGCLHNFLVSHSGSVISMSRNSDITGELLALEVRPGILLRLDTHPSPDKFSNAARDGDFVMAAGQLISIVAADGISHSPLALLANHMETALSSMCIGVGDENVISSNRAADFVLSCLHRFPFRLCKALARQAFLEPFSRVVGQARSHELLLLQARATSSALTRFLHSLGLVLGVSEWTHDFQDRLNASVPSHTISDLEIFEPQETSSTLELYENGIESFDNSPPESDVESVSDVENDTSISDSSDEKFVLANTLSIEELAAVHLMSNEEREEVSNLDTAGEERVVTCLKEENTNACQTIIDRIRRKEFGIGIELDEAGQELMQVQQQRLGRSLDRLSLELYSKATHFVLELVQNADDNHYPEGKGVQPPSLLFVVEQNGLTILNNELGFHEKNVAAICDIGRSTKGKQEFGYIGHKGIGFKSVFKVTDRPEIHSNGFHFFFDKNSGPTGYILPHWVDHEPPMDLPQVEGLSSNWTTRIILPLKSEAWQSKNLFQDLHPSILMFLHRLQHIFIVNKVNDTIHTMRRQDLADDLLEIEHNGDTNRYLVVRKKLDASKMKENVMTTELSLAFPLETSGIPDKQPVFAFLPLRNYGFRFMIQGDFDVPSSREDVDRDSIWNQWLRSELPALFLRALRTFQKHRCFKSFEGLCHFLKFVPLPDEILDFFQPVARQIMQQLKALPWLPAREGPGDETVFRLPSQTVIAQDALLQNIVTPEFLKQHLGLAYLHESVCNTIGQARAAALGVRHLAVTDLVSLTHAAASAANAHGEVEKFTVVGQLLACIRRRLEQEPEQDDEICTALRNHPIIPLSDGRFVTLVDHEVFFPPGQRTDSGWCQDDKKTKLGELQTNLCVLHPALFLGLDATALSQMWCLLEQLQVRHITPREVIEHHVIPEFRSGAWKEKPKALVQTYLMYLESQWESDESVCDLKALRGILPVMTNCGFRCPSTESTYFTTKYLNHVDLPRDLP